jgi:hypothetical protein
MEATAMRRFVAALLLTLVLAVTSGGAPAPGRASCASTAPLTEVAKEPGTAVFTGWASARVAGSQDLVFTVDRWFHGRHAAREVRLLGSGALLEDAATRWPVETALAEVVAGDAISLRLDEPVLMVGEWVAAERAFGVRFCTLAGLPLASPEGKAALAEARAAFGRGRASSALPDTATNPTPRRDAPSASTVLPEWSLPVLALMLAASIMLIVRRLGGRLHLGA